jgi:Holliday junction resolvase RusA-like endonuclease
MSISFTIYGEPASKSNQRRLVYTGGSPRFIKSKKALSYVQSFVMQARPMGLEMFPAQVDVAVTIHIFYASRRPDLDESVVLDAMQNIVYENDRQVKAKHIFWGLDKAEPRCEIKVEAMPLDGGVTQRDEGRAAADGRHQPEGGA